MNLRARLGWGLAIVSLPVWCASFLVVPLLPLSVAQKATAAAASIGAGEGLFWLGVLLAGPEVVAFFRGRRGGVGGQAK